ncbi:MerR family transcriptional regulator [Aeromicrobium alkaliterrae]|uniref:MerR family transcriptional regulator n=1 Tax=Aeromicrobium alkaliterrae TaxID=302168 RepID=A0ABP4VPT4_9ACTN
MRAAMTIGDFAALTHLTIRTLRHYHETGVLEPAQIDPVTGYRFYAAEQIPTARTVHRLRELDLPLPEIKAVLATDDPAQRAEIVSQHLARLEAELDRTRAAVSALRQLLDPEPPAIEVELRAVPARTVAVARSAAGLDDVLGWYDVALAELQTAVPPDERRGPLTGVFANALFSEGAGDVSLHFSVDPGFAASSRSRVEIATLPAVELALVVHPGSHDTIEETYSQLGAWVADHALAVGDVVHETYLVGPRDTSDASAWRTEIGWPVLRIG